MKSRIFGAALFSVLLASANAFAQIKVVATTQDLESIAREIGGTKVSVDSLAKGYQDPHFVEAKPSFILKLHSTDLLIAVGRELEIGWLPPLINQARNPRIQPNGDRYLDASQTAKILEIPTGQITRGMFTRPVIHITGLARTMGGALPN
jgi:zinc/manganese transport system substrate-binding protein